MSSPVLRMTPLGPDAVVDGAIMDAPAVAESIKKTFLAGKFKPRSVCYWRIGTFRYRETGRRSGCDSG